MSLGEQLSSTAFSATSKAAELASDAATLISGVMGNSFQKKEKSELEKTTEALCLRIVEPFSLMVALAVHAKMEEGTRLHFEQHVPKQDRPSLGQGILRRWNSEGRNDLLGLADTVTNALILYQPWQPKNIVIRGIFEHSIIGLTRLQKLYPESDQKEGTDVVRTTISSAKAMISQNLKNKFIIAPSLPEELITYQKAIRLIGTPQKIREIAIALGVPVSTPSGYDLLTNMFVEKAAERKENDSKDVAETKEASSGPDGKPTSLQKLTLPEKVEPILADMTAQYLRVLNVVSRQLLTFQRINIEELGKQTVDGIEDPYLKQIPKVVQDPFTLMVQLSLLYDYPVGTRIGFKKCQVRFYPPSLTQWWERMGEASRDDFVIVPVREFIQDFLTEFPPSKNREIHLLCQRTVLGLKNLFEPKGAAYGEPQKGMVVKFSSSTHHLTKAYLTGLITLIESSYSSTAEETEADTLYHRATVYSRWGTEQRDQLFALLKLSPKDEGEVKSEADAKESSSIPKLQEQELGKVQQFLQEQLKSFVTTSSGAAYQLVSGKSITG